MNKEHLTDNAYKIKYRIKEILPRKLKEYRNKAGYTTYDIGSLLNKNQSTVAQWETGRTLPDIPTLLQLCQLYKISNAAVFLDLTDAVEPELNSKDISRSERELIDLWRKSKPHVRASIKTLLKECNSNNESFSATENILKTD